MVEAIANTTTAHKRTAMILQQRAPRDLLLEPDILPLASCS